MIPEIDSMNAATMSIPPYGSRKERAVGWIGTGLCARASRSGIRCGNVARRSRSYSAPSASRTSRDDASFRAASTAVVATVGVSTSGTAGRSSKNPRGTVNSLKNGWRIAIAPASRIGISLYSPASKSAHSPGLSSPVVTIAPSMSESVARSPKNASFRRRSSMPIR